MATDRPTADDINRIIGNPDTPVGNTVVRRDAADDVGRGLGDAADAAARLAATLPAAGRAATDLADALARVARGWGQFAAAVERDHRRTVRHYPGGGLAADYLADLLSPDAVEAVERETTGVDRWGRAPGATHYAHDHHPRHDTRSGPDDDFVAGT